MKTFAHINAQTVAEATAALNQYKDKAKVIAGGTDLLDRMKNRIYYPVEFEAIVNLKTIPGLDYVKEEGGVLKIGALTRIEDIAESTVIKGKYGSLAHSASEVAAPQQRHMGTIGGNLCQEVRCWYFRANDNYFHCFRKGGALCYAVPGDNIYNAILKGQVCFAVCPGDTPIALTALNATIITSKKRSIPIGDFYTVLGTVLAVDEIVTEVQVPEPKTGTKQTFIKFRERKSLDFAMSSVATAITVAGGTVTDARIVLGGVAPMPYRATDAENTIKGKAINESLAETVASEAVKGAQGLSKNKFKIPLTKALVKRAILA